MRGAATTLWLALMSVPFGASAAEIALSFGDAPGGSSGGFRIERREAGAKHFEPIALVGPGVPDFVDRGLPAGSTYCYRVRALAAEGASAWSPEVCTVAEEEPLVAEGSAPGGEPGSEGATDAEAASVAAPPAPAASEPRRIRTSGGWLQVLD